MNRIAVSPRVVRWAQERAGFAVADLEDKFPRLSDWETEAVQPTMRQLEDFAKANNLSNFLEFLERISTNSLLNG